MGLSEGQALALVVRKLEISEQTYYRAAPVGMRAAPFTGKGPSERREDEARP